MLMPNGREVFSRMRRIEARASSGVSEALARMPSPPASQTATTSSGIATLLMPELTMGCSMPSSSVMRVFMAVFLVIVVFRP
ncbi:hypothetical protein D3C76_948880 [compost metagenome]